MNCFELRHQLLQFALALLIAVPGAIVASELLKRFRSPLTAELLLGSPQGSPNLVPGIQRPQTVAAQVADLPDDEPIIGVSINNRHRAYRGASLSPMMAHVVNDLVAQTPVTVTYCDRTDCARVFTGETEGALDVWTGGFLDGLLLKHNDRFFHQTTGKYVGFEERDDIALPMLPHARTTWKKWRDAHPETDVYLGQ